MQITWNLKFDNLCNPPPLKNLAVKLNHFWHTFANRVTLLINPRSFHDVLKVISTYIRDVHIICGIFLIYEENCQVLKLNPFPCHEGI